MERRLATELAIREAETQHGVSASVADFMSAWGCLRRWHSRTGISLRGAGSSSGRRSSPGLGQASRLPQKLLDLKVVVQFPVTRRIESRPKAKRPGLDLKPLAVEVRLGWPKAATQGVIKSLFETLPLPAHGLPQALLHVGIKSDCRSHAYNKSIKKNVLSNHQSSTRLAQRQGRTNRGFAHRSLAWSERPGNAVSQMLSPARPCQR